MDKNSVFFEKNTLSVHPS